MACGRPRWWGWDSSAGSQVYVDRLFEDGRRNLDAAYLQTIKNLGRRSRGAEAALHFAGIGHAQAFEGEDLLQLHLVVFHAQDFRNAENFAGAVLQSRNLHHHFDGAGQLLQNHPRGNLQVGHHHHGFQAGEGVARRIGMDGAHGALHAGVHGLQHIERFSAAALAHDDAVGPHTQRRPQQNPLIDAAFLVDIGRPRFELHHVALLQLQLGCIFDGDDALLFGDEAGEPVQHGGFAGPGAAGDQNGGLGLYAGGQEAQHSRRQRLVLQHLLLGDHVASEAANAEARAVERQRRNDGIYARSVLQAGVDDRLCLVDAAAHLRDDLFDDVQQVRVVLEAHRRFREFAVALDEDFVIAIDQDVADTRFLQERLQRAETEHFVENFLDDLGLFGGGHGDALVVEQALDHASDFGAEPLFGNRRDALQVEHADELAMDFALQLEIAVGAAGGHGRRTTTRR